MTTPDIVWLDQLDPRVSAEIRRLRAEIERQCKRLPDFYREVFRKEFPGDIHARAEAAHVLAELRARLESAEQDAMNSMREVTFDGQTVWGTYYTKENT